MKYKYSKLYCETILALARVMKRIPDEYIQEKNVLREASSVLKKINTEMINKNTREKKCSKRPKLMFGYNTVSK